MPRTTSRRVGGTRTIRFERVSSLGALASTVPAAARAGALLAGEYLRGLAVEQTPVEMGDLRNSSSVEPYGDTGARVVYDSVYAAYQHEVPMNHPRGGKDHYLSDPLRDNARDIVRMMGQPIRDAIGGN